ncbi:flagellin [Ammoniphilus resinae]|uniref:Flagellin n=1 Tax=Ammoniphilus resinae TaxID=861532 RepID=A0ABS4GMJ4_9BACL|nr:flagellin [Ammoniphilus resinae]MBP1931484.1 flagellin [Ammoniphilus resinae]
MRINHNIQALNTYRQLSQNQGTISKHLERLSSGLRINRAADDAAGLAISEKMRSQIKGLAMAERNALDGISLIQTAEGALNETNAILQRMRELAVQAANDTMTDEDRVNIQKEVNALTDEINRIGNTTNFNTRKLLNGDVSANVATPARIVGEDLGASVEIIPASTKGTATGTAVNNPVEIHGDTNGFATGNIKVNDTDLTGTPITINSSNNELTLTVGGVQKTIVLTDGVTYNGTAPTDLAALINDIKAELDAAFGSGQATAAVDSNGFLQITDNTTTGANSIVTIDGGNAAATLFGSPITSTSGAKNDELTFELDGVPQTITLSQGTYSTPTDLINELNTLATTPAPGIAVTFSLNGNAIVAASNSSGATSSVTNIGGDAATDLGLVGATIVNGKDQNNELKINVEGTEVTAIIPDATYTDLDVLATAVQDAVNTALAAAGSSATVNVTHSNGNLTIEDTKDGKLSTIEITNGTAATIENKAAANALGFIGDGITNSSDMGEDGSDNALQMQIGSNKGDQLAISIDDARAFALGLTHTVSSTMAFTGHDGSTIDVEYSSTNTITNNGVTEYVLDISTHDAAEKAISVIDNSITVITTQRANLGAVQNRLEHTISNLGTTNENLTASESRIRDADMAMEMAEFTKNNIINQAATAMLAQANQLPQGILQLLK